MIKVYTDCCFIKMSGAELHFNRLLKKSFGWFDRLTTNGLKLMNSISPPFSLSLSKGE